jgi:hypothetical protein
MDEKSQIPPKVLNELLLFMKQSKPGRLSRNLRGMLLTVLMTQKDAYCFDMDDLLADLSYLFDFLDAIEDS